MKTYNKDHLPDYIDYKGERYMLNVEISGAMNANNTSVKTISNTLKKEKRRGVLVNCMDKRLKGKRDLHHKPYEPTKWIYTTNKNPGS